MEKKGETLPEGIVIRPVTAADARDISAIYNHYVTATTVSFETEPVTAEEMERRVAEISAAFPYYVCETGGRVAGWCCAHPWKDRAAYARTWETTVYLSPEARGRGAGAALMARLVEACRADGRCHALVACITAENAASIAFHTRLGFRRVSLFKEVGRKMGRWLDVADYELLL